MSPKVAVVYLTYNTPASAVDIPDCFQTLEKVNYPLDRWRIIICENPSRHGKSYPMIEERYVPKVGETLPEIEIIPNEKDLGFAGANVRALEAAKAWGADYIYLLNQDAIVTPDFLKNIVDYAEAHPNTAVMQSRIMLKQAPELLNARGNALHYLGFGFSLGYKQTPGDAARNTLPMFYASGAGVLIRVSVTDQIGLFAPSYYMYHEDVDVCWRARLAGYDIAYVPNSVMYHHYEFSKSIGKFYWMERNRHLTNFVNYKIGTLLLLAPALKIMDLGILMFELRSGRGVPKLKSYVFFLKPSTWKWILDRRRGVKKFRKVSDKKILESMVGVIEAQEVENTLLSKFVNPVFNAYFHFVKAVVRW